MGWRLYDGSVGAGIHSSLEGLTNDDHTQYILHSLATAVNDFLIASGSGTFVKKTLAETGAILETDLDHGSIQGLADDDHTIYLRADGSRALAGAWDMGNQSLTNVNADSGTIDGVTIGGAVVAAGSFAAIVGTSLSFAGDVFLERDAANTLAQRNGVTGQLLRVYNTFTDASNYERIVVGWSSNVASVGPEKAGTGVNREFRVGAEGSSLIRFQIAGTPRWDINASGDFVAATDNTNDIGASGATRPRDLFLGRNAVIGGDLNVAGAGPHAIGGAASAEAGIFLRGSPTLTGNVTGNFTAGLLVDIEYTATIGDDAYIVMLGVNENGTSTTITEAASGIHNVIATMGIVAPVLGAGGASTTNAAALRIVNAPTGATNNYALWVDSGVSRFDDAIVLGVTGSVNGIIYSDDSIYLNIDANDSATGNALIIATNRTGTSGGTVLMTLADGGLLLLNETANTKMTMGMTIHQAANDDEAFAVKSSDIAHGCTDIAETDTYGYLKKTSGDEAGLEIGGFADGTNQIGVLIWGTAIAQDATKSTAGVGAVEIRASDITGSARQSAGTGTANANLLVVRDNITTRFILDEDGDSHQDVGTAWTNFDEENDDELLNILSAHLTRLNDPLRASFGQWLEKDREPLERHKLVTFNEDGHHFANWSRFHMLEVGTLRQHGSRLEKIEQKLLALEGPNA